MRDYQSWVEQLRQTLLEVVASIGLTQCSASQQYVQTLLTDYWMMVVAVKSEVSLPQHVNAAKCT